VDGALWGAGWGVVVWVDEDFGEEDGVEEFLEAGWGIWVGVEVVAVFEEGEGFSEVLFDAFAVGGEGGEFSGDVVEFASEAGLFGFEEVEGDGVGVVGFEEFGLLGFEFAGLGGELLGVGVLAGVDVVEFEVEVFLDGLPVFGGDVDVVVEVGNASVDFVDEDGFEGAFGAVALTVGADEVRINLAVSGFGVVDDELRAFEKIEDLTAQHAKEREALQAQLKRKSDDYEAQAKVLTTKNERINHLDLELAKKTKAIETQTPEQRGDVLREEAAEISYKAEVVLRGQVWTPFEALTAHTEATGIDHKQFMSGVLTEYQLILSELKERFGLDDTPSGEALPEWAREDYQPDGKLDESVTSILDEIERDAHIQDAEVVG